MDWLWEKKEIGKKRRTEKPNDKAKLPWFSKRGVPAIGAIFSYLESDRWILFYFSFLKRLSFDCNEFLSKFSFGLSDFQRVLANFPKWPIYF